ncbi:MAG: multidrug effflux MFS transporter [Gammaproteobacteria bacterium]|nr:multidrug effflux MFS transporter [Gammaproteobacteria bacterium]
MNKTKTSNYFFIVAVLLSSLGQVASDIYLPSMPYIAHDLHSSFTLVQFSLAVFMLGFCLPRIVYGVLSDAFGRRNLTFVGLSIAFLGTFICFSAINMPLLIVGRFLQGFGMAGCVTLAGAMVRDTYDGAVLAKFNSYFAIANVLLMSITPVIGGFIQQYLFWRASFVLILAWSFIALFLFKTNVQETNFHKDITHVRWSSIFNNIKTLFLKKTYLGAVGCIFLSYAGILAWLTLGPILLQHHLHITTVQYGFLCGFGGLSYVIGGFFSSKMVGQLGSRRLIFIGLLFYITAGIVLLLVGAFLHLTWILLVIPVYLYLIGTGMVFPNAYTCALLPFARMAGMAVAVTGTVQILGGFVASSVIAFLPHNASWPMAIVILLSGIFGLAFFRML